MSQLSGAPPKSCVPIFNSLCMPDCTLESVRPHVKESCKKPMVFEEIIEEHNASFRADVGIQQPRLEPRGALAARSWMTIKDSLAGRD